MFKDAHRLSVGALALRLLGDCTQLRAVAWWVLCLVGPAGAVAVAWIASRSAAARWSGLPFLLL